MSGPIQIAHRDIFAGYQNSTEDYWAKALGGGRLWIGNGKLVAFDFSGDYGPADETIVRLLLMPYCQTKNLELILRNKASRWDCPEIDQK